MIKTIRVVITEDHTIRVRQGLAHLLSDQPGLEVVGQAVNGRDAVEMAEKLNPDIIIMDIAMPKMNGIEASKNSETASGTKILILPCIPTNTIFMNCWKWGFPDIC